VDVGGGVYAVCSVHFSADLVKKQKITHLHAEQPLPLLFRSSVKKKIIIIEEANNPHTHKLHACPKKLNDNNDGETG
jgi:hypothetical protein